MHLAQAKVLYIRLMTMHQRQVGHAQLAVHADDGAGGVRIGTVGWGAAQAALHLHRFDTIHNLKKKVLRPEVQRCLVADKAGDLLAGLVYV